MALTRGSAAIRAGLAGVLALGAPSVAPLVATTASAAQTPAPSKLVAPATAPAGKPDAAPEATDSDTWIFSGILQDSSETFSGTLVTGKSDTQFELKLADGATCDGADLKPSLGMVKLDEIQCTDGRAMRALFVPQPRQTLRVFGHVGDARFAATAHILGTQPIPEPAQTTAPHAPMPAPDQPPPTAPTPGPNRPSGDDPG